VKKRKPENQKKKWVKERYGAIAAGAQQTCCREHTCCASPADVAEKIGYSADEVAAAPQGANLNLGCGNPLALASIEPGEIVLDLGSGAGFDVFLAAARVGPMGRVIGVDMTPEMIEKARANAERAGYSNVEFRQGDIEALPVEDASVDLVISNCVLNLVPDKPKAFREIARVLKPGGRIAVADIVLDKPLPEALKGDADAYCSCVSGAIGRAKYLRLLEQAGLSNVRVVSEADAAQLLAGDCCGAGVGDLTGVVTSVHITARKPAGERRL
jgi:SAM-dependent methyltransferase